MALFEKDRKTNVYHYLGVLFSARRELYLFALRLAQIKNKVNLKTSNRDTLQSSLMATKLLLVSPIEKKKLKFI